MISIHVQKGEATVRLIKKHKFVVICVLIDILLFWLLFYSGLILPFINPTLEDYQAILNSAPRHAGQMGLWLMAHMPTSGLISALHLAEPFLILSIFQTAVAAYGIEKIMGQMQKAKRQE
jgi:hypothetical protein